MKKSSRDDDEAPANPDAICLDIGQVLTYFVAHDAHHRGQIVMVARHTAHRLSSRIHAGLWHWKA